MNRYETLMEAANDESMKSINFTPEQSLRQPAPPMEAEEQISRLSPLKCSNEPVVADSFGRSDSLSNDIEKESNSHYVLLDLSEDNSDEHTAFKLSTLYSPDLNQCVDHILSNKPNHLDMIHQLEAIYGRSKRDLMNSKYIVRHRKR